jgi:hypothetical protein
VYVDVVWEVVRVSLSLMTMIDTTTAITAIAAQTPATILAVVEELF